MAANKVGFLIFCAFSFVSCVLCDLNITEGSPCTTEGVNGTCVNIYRCISAAITFIYTRAGFDEKRYNFVKLPETCSYDNDEPIVCCTDCVISDSKSFSNMAVRPLGGLVKRDGAVAWGKCLDYFEKLPYRCRGVAAMDVKNIWNDEKKCFNLYFSRYLAVGGRDARKWEFPHVALLGYGDDPETADWLCGGSVISERYILTAAHCTSTRALGNITFAALGLLKRTEPKKTWKIYKIKRIIIHPEYHAPSKYHDIALLETDTEISFGEELLPACLDTGKQGMSPAEASGWGRLGHKQDLADTLQVVNLQEFEDLSCARMYQPHRHLKNGYDHRTQMCYGSYDKIVDTCEGDSGGPLQVNEFKCQYTVIGVTSYGKDCGVLGSAGMYTRVSHYVPWIEEVVWPEETAARRDKENLWLDKWLNGGSNDTNVSS